MNKDGRLEIQQEVDRGFFNLLIVVSGKWCDPNIQDIMI